MAEGRGGKEKEKGKDNRQILTFPNTTILLNYAIPSTSTYDDALLGRPCRGHLDVVALAQLCELYFPFGALWLTLLEKFVKSASPAFVMDGLIGEFHDLRTSRAVLEPVILRKREPSLETGFSEFRCALPTADVMLDLVTSLRGLRDPSRRRGPHLVALPSSLSKKKEKAKTGCRARRTKDKDISCFVAWIPSTVLYQVMPEAVETFDASKRQRRKGSKVEPVHTGVSALVLTCNNRC